MRHGEAIDPNFWGPNDATRPLSDLGIAKLVNGALGMVKESLAPALIVSSPYHRAVQTAEIFSEYLNIKFEVVSGLASGARPDALRKALLPYKDKPSLLVVGHMPDLAVFTARAADSAQWLDRTLKPGDMVCLDTPALDPWGQARIRWERTLDDWKKGLE